MNLFLKWSIRDLLLITLVLALVVALWLSRVEIEKAKKWRAQSLTLQSLLEGEGFEIEWHPESKSMSYQKPGGRGGGGMSFIEEETP